MTIEARPPKNVLDILRHVGRSGQCLARNDGRIAKIRPNKLQGREPNDQYDDSELQGFLKHTRTRISPVQIMLEYSRFRCSIQRSSQYLFSLSSSPSRR